MPVWIVVSTACGCVPMPGLVHGGFVCLLLVENWSKN
jgi:hypothetical protein